MRAEFAADRRPTPSVRGLSNFAKAFARQASPTVLITDILSWTRALSPESLEVDNSGINDKWLRAFHDDTPPQFRYEVYP